MHLSISSGKVADDARRLTSCIIGAGDATGNLAHEAVSAVEMQLLQKGWPVGEALGALPDFQRDLGLGRPACREAMIILEARGLLDVRRGPGGGLFVAAPSVDDVVGAMLMYLTVSGTGAECIEEFRLLVWRMIVEAAIDRGTSLPVTAAAATEWGFAVDLARRIGNPAMAIAAQVAESLVRACEGRAVPAHDLLLEHAVQRRDARGAFSRLDDLAAPAGLAAPLLALEALEQRIAGSGHKSAMVLAARMTREMVRRPEKLEAEWETAERLGYSDSVVRQARRILQDFGVVRCQRGRKGAVWGAPASPAGVIRMLAPCFVASGATARDNAEAANFLACNAPPLAARRAVAEPAGQARALAAVDDSRDLVDMIRIENLLLALAGNPLLSIMTRSLGLANLLNPDAEISQRRRADIVAINYRILRAIKAGDADTAGHLARSKGEIQQSEAGYRKLA
jgi:DNA-binding FadR family transcriptional regulator